MRRCASLTLLVLLSLVLAGCGAKAGLTVGEAAQPFFRSADDLPWSSGLPKGLPKGLPEGSLQSSRSFETIVEDLEASRSVDSARQKLRELYERGDYDKALVNGLCAGMEQIKEQGVPATTDEWRSFLVAYLAAVGKDFVLHYVHADAVAKVDGLVTTWDLGQVSPAAARTYYQACVA